MEIKLQKIKEAGMAHAIKLVPSEQRKEMKELVIAFQDSFVADAIWHHQKASPEIKSHENEILLCAKKVKEFEALAKKAQIRVQEEISTFGGSPILNEVMVLLKSIAE